MYILHGVYDRSRSKAKQVSLSWPKGWTSMLATMAANKSTSNVASWCVSFAEHSPLHDKLDSLSVTKVTALVFDVDKSNGATQEELLDTFDSLNVGYVYWQTWRSRPGAVRMRIVLPLENPVNIPLAARMWEDVIRRLLPFGVLVHRGKGAPDSGIVVDGTSPEPSRLHVLPVNGNPWGVRDGPLLEPPAQVHTPEVVSAASTMVPAPNDTVAIKTVGDTDLATCDIEWEADPSVTTPVADITPEVIRLMARPTEPGKARCRCPYLSAEQSAASYSAWARYVRGVLYISCSSAHHSHAAGATWAAQTQSDVTTLAFPAPYSRSTTGALLALSERISKGKKKKDDDSGGDTDVTERYRVVSYTTPIIAKLYHDTETSDEWWQLQWNHIAGGYPVTTTLRRDDLGTASKLAEKAGRLGLDVNESNKKELTRYLSDFVAHNRERIPIQMTASHMGWFGDSFLLGRTWIAGDDSPVRELVVAASDGGTKVATAFFATGLLRDWASAFKMLEPYPLVVAGIYAACASVLINRIGCQSFAIEWASGTGTGKTSSMRMAESVFGKPLDCEVSWDNTKVRFERQAAFLGNIPMFLDDTKTSEEHDPRRLAKALEWAIYRAVSGQGRGRGTPGGMAQTANWSLVLFSTGEEPIYGQGQAGGARARLISIQAPPFNTLTKDATSKVVAPIADMMAANHGTLGPAFIQRASTISTAKLREVWTARRAYWLAKMQATHSASDRVASHLAVIEIAGKIIHSIFSRDNIDVGGIKPEAVVATLAEHMCEVDQQIGITDPILRSYYEFYSWCCANRGYFWTVGKEDRTPNGGWWGRWDGGDEWNHLYFNHIAVNRFLRETGHSGSPATVIAGWTQQGLLARPKKGIKHSVRIDGSMDGMWCATREKLTSPMNVIEAQYESEEE